MERETSSEGEVLDLENLWMGDLYLFTVLNSGLLFSHGRLSKQFLSCCNVLCVFVHSNSCCRCCGGTNSCRPRASAVASWVYFLCLVITLTCMHWFHVIATLI